MFTVSSTRAGKAAATIGLSVLLGACGGGGGSGSSTGSLTLGVTDMPVDEALEVNVVFTGITVKPANGERLVFNCDDPDFDCGGTGRRLIDLLTLTGDESETLLDNAIVPAGNYEWIRLHVDAAGPQPGSTGASNIVLESTGEHALAIPSGRQTGLKLVSGFTVPAGGDASFTIDFDLRKAIVHRHSPQPPNYMLKPALRLVDNTTAGTIAGTFEPSQYGDCTTPENAAVYVYDGGTATTGDIGGPNAPTASIGLSDDDGDGVTEPSDSDGVYAFEIGFLDAGDYTVAITCEADNDGEDGGDALAFVGVANDVTVVAGATTGVTFDGTP